MTIYTSSFFTYKGNRGVDIAVSKPTLALVSKTIDILKPKWELVEAWNNVKHLSDTDPKKLKVMQYYTMEYLAKLERIGIERILMELEDGDVLLCWCSKMDFCHRKIIAVFLRSHGIIVTEL